MREELYYKPSGGAPFFGLMITMIVGTLGGAVLSIIYALVNYYNPFIYFTVIATGIFGAGCGGCAVMGLSLGKVRGRLTNAFAGFIIGFASLYLAWVWYLFLAARTAFGQGLFFFDTTAMFSFMQLIAANGMWEIGGATPTGGILYTIWVIEAFIVLIPAILIAFSADTPFREPCNQWSEEMDCSVTFRVPEEIDQLRQSLEDENYSPLFENALMSPEDVCLHAKIHRCPKCDGSTWLELEQVSTWLNDKGEAQSSKNTVIKHLAISRQYADALLTLMPDSTNISSDESSVMDDDLGEETFQDEELG